MRIATGAPVAVFLPIKRPQTLARRGDEHGLAGKKNFQFNPRVKMPYPAVCLRVVPDFPPPLPPAALVPSCCVSRAERASWSSAHMGSRSSVHHGMLSGLVHIVPDTLIVIGRSGVRVTSPAPLNQSLTLPARFLTRYHGVSAPPQPTPGAGDAGRPWQGQGGSQPSLELPPPRRIVSP